MKIISDWFLAQTPAEQRDFLRKLKQYRSLVKLLWKRGKALFARLEKKEAFVYVEFPSLFPQESREQEVRTVLTKYFPEVATTTIEWKEKPDLRGGLRIFVNGEMWDGSWKGIREKFENGR